ncbi:MAG: hypothetical protein Q9201_007647 [Fulgogasparrea decipioides]
MAELLKAHAQPQNPGAHSQVWTEPQREQDSGQSPPDSRYFDFAEEVTNRVAWCPTEQDKPAEDLQRTNVTPSLERANTAEDDPSKSLNGSLNENAISITSPLPPRNILTIPFSKLAEPVEKGLFAKGSHLHQVDDHEQPLPQLVHRALLSLPPDVRSLCMARIIITGGGSNITGLKTRLLKELISIVDQRGWDPVNGKIADERRQRLKEISNNRQKADASFKGAGLQVEDEITETLEKEKSKKTKPTVAGEIRGVETLGAWAGGSLVASLKVKGVVEIERDSFLSNGLAGAKRQSEIINATSRLSLGARSSLDTKMGWTLGAWA